MSGRSPAMVEHRATSLDRQALRAARSGTPIPTSTSSFVNRVVRKPWGYEYPLYVGQASAIWLLHVMPNQMTSMHCHRKKKTVLVVLRGCIQCKTLSGETTRLRGQGVCIGTGAFHQSVAGSEGAILMELETPVDKGDLVRLQDSYGRQQGYEGVENTSELPEGHRTVTELPEGVTCNRFVGELRLSIRSPIDGLTGSQSDDLLCVLAGSADDVEGGRILRTGDCLDVRSIGRRIRRWERTSLVAIISSVNTPA